MRIVTSEACHLAFPKAGRHAQAIGCVRDLKAVIALIDDGVEIDFVIAQRLPGPVGIYRAIKAANLVWHVATAGFKMALHTNIHLAIAVELCWINDCVANFLYLGACDCSVHMGAARSMTSLAIDTRRKLAGKRLCNHGGRVESVGVAGIGVMAKHAFSRYGTVKVLLVVSIKSWAHCEVAGILCIPTHRKFEELSLCVAMQKSVRVITRADDIVHLFFNHICFCSAKSDLRSSLEQLAVVRDQRIVHGRWLVIDACSVKHRCQFAWICCSERASHSRFTVGARNLLVASGTHSRGDIFRGGRDCFGMGGRNGALRILRRCTGAEASREESACSEQATEESISR